MMPSLLFYQCPEQKISFDGFVNYEGHRFGVPYSYHGSTDRITRKDDMIYIYCTDLKQLWPPTMQPRASGTGFVLTSMRFWNSRKSFLPCRLRLRSSSSRSRNSCFSLRSSTLTRRSSGMTESVFESVEKSCQILRLDFSSAELATMAQEHELTPE